MITVRRKKKTAPLTIGIGLIAPAIAMIMAACGSGDSADEAPIAPVSQEEYAVYNCVMEKLYQGQGVKMVVIGEETFPVSLTGGDMSTFVETDGRQQRLWEVFRKQFHAVDGKVMSDFQRKNREPAILQNEFHPSMECHIFTPQEREEIFSSPESDGWKAFRDRFPGAKDRLLLSRVGFSKDGAQALVYAAQLWATIDGVGNVIWLSKKDGKWVVEDMFECWLS